MATKKKVSKAVEKKVEAPKQMPVTISPQELELLNQKRKENENAKQCASEIAAVLKKYNMHFETTKPEIIVVLNPNA